jgi:hypothetical protein
VTLVGGLMGGVVVGVGGVTLFTGINTEASTIPMTAKIIIADVTPNAICTLLDGLLVPEFPISVFYDILSKRKSRILLVNIL